MSLKDLIVVTSSFTTLPIKITDMATLCSGHEVEKLEGDELKEQETLFKGYDMGLVRLHPGKWLLLGSFINYADDVYNFKFKPDDVFIMTYPKVGTTWTQEVIWTMRNNPNIDNPEGDLPINTRSPFIEQDMLFASKNCKKPAPDSEFVKDVMKRITNFNPKRGMAIQMSESLPEPRTIKCHLPLCLMHKDIIEKCKIVYVVRNPKDVVVSYLHHSRIFKAHNYLGSDEQFVDYFTNGDLLYGSYDQHLKEALKIKDHSNFLLLNFEDMKKDPKCELKRLDEFIGTNLTDEQMDKIVKYTSFEEMKKRDNLMGNLDELDVFDNKIVEKSGGFFREGQSGSYKKKLTPELEKKIDEWTKTKCKDIGFEFKYSS